MCNLAFARAEANYVLSCMITYVIVANGIVELWIGSEDPFEVRTELVELESKQKRRHMTGFPGGLNVSSAGTSVCMSAFTCGHSPRLV